MEYQIGCNQQLPENGTYYSENRQQQLMKESTVYLIVGNGQRFIGIDLVHQTLQIQKDAAEKNIFRWIPKRVKRLVLNGEEGDNAHKGSDGEDEYEQLAG